MPNDVDRYVGLAIQRARRTKGLTQSDLADKVGVSFQQIHKYESASNRISASMLAAVAEALGVSVCDLFPQRLRSFEPRDGELELLIHFRALSKEQRTGLLNDVRRAG
jgi:transcriptional regulator with XRE-family HTH domain